MGGASSTGEGASASTDAGERMCDELRRDDASASMEGDRPNSFPPYASAKSEAESGVAGLQPKLSQSRGHERDEVTHVVMLPCLVSRMKSLDDEDDEKEGTT